MDSNCANLINVLLNTICKVRNQLNGITEGPEGPVGPTGPMGFRLTQVTMVDPIQGSDSTGSFGGSAFSTIQAALNAIPTATNASEMRRQWVILVAPNTYDESLSIDLSGKLVTIIGLGQWNLGEWSGSAWEATNNRSIYITHSSGSLIDSIVPSFSLGTVSWVGEGFTSHPSYASRPRVSGTLYVDTPVDLQLNLGADFFGFGNVLSMSTSGAGNVYMYLRSGRCRGEVSGLGNCILQSVDRWQFDGDISIKYYSNIQTSAFGSGVMTVLQFPPNLESALSNWGFYRCYFPTAFEFIGPAGTTVYSLYNSTATGIFRVDGPSNYYFVINAGLLSTGTKTVIDNLTP